MTVRIMFLCYTYRKTRGKGKDMNIYLLRHGETDWNEVGRLQGHTDIPLSEKGRMQMSGVAKVLSGLALKPDLMISSPLRRAQESAEIVADRLCYPKERILTEELLIECCFGAGEGLTAEERKAKYPDADYPGREPFADLVKRAHSAFAKITDTKREADNVLVVAHGMILYALLKAVTGREVICGVSSGPTFEQGSIYRIEYIDNGIRVAKYNNGKFIFE